MGFKEKPSRSVSKAVRRLKAVGNLDVASSLRDKDIARRERLLEERTWQEELDTHLRNAGYRDGIRSLDEAGLSAVAEWRGIRTMHRDGRLDSAELDKEIERFSDQHDGMFVDEAFKFSVRYITERT
ncbi:hypothetical protein A2686_02460 [Candidatus Woesebacteria bacterium RIFCSPHIGHO2_01_FULL_38_10]|nr:MAG: hypothetical protein A2686_02460 [Candidatus Woesebacteria bacterium RIFCSPHIGHO2_01_FULL_38_10]